MQKHFDYSPYFRAKKLKEKEQLITILFGSLFIAIVIVDIIIENILT